MQNRIMSRRRSSIDILHDILNLCDSEGLKNTAIMHRGNLSYDQLRRYLTVLMRQGILPAMTLGTIGSRPKGGTH